MIGFSFLDVMSHQVREVLLCAADVEDAADKYHQSDHRRYGEACIVHRDVTEDDRPVRVEKAGESVHAHSKLPRGLIPF